MKQRITLDRPALTVTLLFTVAMLFLCAIPLWFPPSTLWLAIPSFFLLVLMYILSPTSVKLTDKALVINRVVGGKRIPYTDIERVDRVAKPDLTWRLMASGGFMGYWGLFRSRTLGRFNAYIGKPSQSILLMLRDAEPVLFSCENPDEMLVALCDHMASRCE